MRYGEVSRAETDKMIDLTDVSLGGDPEKPLFSRITGSIPTDRRFVLVGSSRDETSTFVQGLAGLLEPWTGKISRGCRLSYPMGHTRCFRAELSVEDNVRYAADVFDAPRGELLDFLCVGPKSEVTLLLYSKLKNELLL